MHFCPCGPSSECDHPRSINSGIQRSSESNWYCLDVDIIATLHCLLVECLPPDPRGHLQLGSEDNTTVDVGLHMCLLQKQQETMHLNPRCAQRLIQDSTHPHQRIGSMARLHAGAHVWRHELPGRLLHHNLKLNGEIFRKKDDSF